MVARTLHSPDLLSAARCRAAGAVGSGKEWFDGRPQPAGFYRGDEKGEEENDIGSTPGGDPLIVSIDEDGREDDALAAQVRARLPLQRRSTLGQLGAF